MRDTPKAVFDHRGYWKVELPRNNKRLIPTSEFLVRSNRANGDVGFMLYEKSPMKPSASEISKVVGYIVDYASKSTETEKQTKDKLKLLINEEKESASNTPDVRRVAIKCMNQITKDKLISKQEAMCLSGGLKLFLCSETIETISMSESKTIDSSGKIEGKISDGLFQKRTKRA